MVAAPIARPLTLLVPPSRPSKAERRPVGWRWRGDVLERRPEHDEQGAEVQWMVLRYYRDGVRRKTLAFEYGYSERVVQTYLSGRSSWGRAYAAPVLDALRAMGVPTVRWRTGISRAVAEVAATRAAIRNAALLLADDPRPEAKRLVRAARLLTIGPGGGNRGR